MLTSEKLEVAGLRRAALPTGGDRLPLAGGDLANLAEESRSLGVDLSGVLDCVSFVAGHFVVAVVTEFGFLVVVVALVLLGIRVGLCVVVRFLVIVVITVVLIDLLRLLLRLVAGGGHRTAGQPGLDAVPDTRVINDSCLPTFRLQLPQLEPGRDLRRRRRRWTWSLRRNRRGSWSRCWLRITSSTWTPRATTTS
jgi:hypothetical protein